MATTSPDNIWTPDAGDDYALTTDLAATADTVQDAITDLRTKTGYRADLTDAQRLALSGGSLFEGLWVRTTDTKIDWLYTGGAWVPWGTSTGSVTVESGWSATAGYTPRVVRNGGVVSIYGAVTNGGGGFTAVVTVPVGFRPAVNTFLSATHSNQAMNGTGLINPAGLITFPVGYFDGALTSGGIVPLVGSWTI